MATYFIDSTWKPTGSQSMRIHPIGTVSRGWRLLIIKRNHECDSCGRIIKSGKAAWFRPFRGKSPEGMRGEYLCQHGHEDRTGVER